MARIQHLAIASKDPEKQAEFYKRVFGFTEVRRLDNPRARGVVLTDGHLPRWVPAGTVWQRVQRREWLLTVNDFRADVADRIRSENPVESVEVCDVTLGELFRDYIKGGADQ